MIRHWFTRADAPLSSGFVKRFDPLHFSVDFPRGAIASVTLGAAPDSLVVTAEFLRRNDLVGLIYDSDDSKIHPCNRREHHQDYRHCKLSFRWQAEGLPGLDDVNGATLTIEGKDSSGERRTWYVRLWNYATGSPTDAQIELDFDNLAGGYNLSTDADPVDPERIDRLFFSLVPQDFSADDGSFLAAGRKATLRLTSIRCEGSGSVLQVNDAMVPEHALRMCTAYDDLYHLVPERIIELVERLGYRKLINHYVGMSHHQSVGSDGLIDPQQPLSAPALAWHRAFAKAAKAAGLNVIFSLSFEIIDTICPEGWKQRSSDGLPALTGYDPPSTLVSPANDEAVDYLSRTAVEFAKIAEGATLQPLLQVGEPWWWVTSDHRPCIYDVEAKAALGGSPVIVEDVRGSKNETELALFEQAGTLLASATSAISNAVKEYRPDARMHLLVYLPSILSSDRPEWYRANIPSEWAFPAFDVLQLEDYEWLTGRFEAQASGARSFVDQHLQYPLTAQHYLAGFAQEVSAPIDWQRIVVGASDALRRGVAEAMVWAFPQVMRDRVTVFEDGEDEMNAFDDVTFPLEISSEASVAPNFSTTVLTSASGHEFRNINWSQGRLRFDAGPGVRGDDELRQLIAFFRARRGSAQAFRFRDPYDFTSNSLSKAPTMVDQLIGVGDGVTSVFQLRKNYGDGEQRQITRPDLASVTIAIAGVAQIGTWRLGDLGAIVFDDPPAPGLEITAGYAFDVPVRFASDQLEINRATFLAGDAPSIPLIEVRETVE